MRPAVFLDRDGVLNASRVVDGTPLPPRTVAEVTLLDGVEEACRRLRDAGAALVVVTNQPDIARGTASRADIEAINEFVRLRLRLHSVVMCPHDDADDCACRKPRPGMLLDSARRLNLDLSKSVMVGDRGKDIAAGKAAGVATVFVDHRYGETGSVEADCTVGSLLEAVPFIRDHVTQGVTAS